MEKVNKTKRFEMVAPDKVESIDPTQVFNINIGIMGHVDSGKTSFCRFISQIVSTASLDKNPQSKERGMTLDIGFTSFYIENLGESPLVAVDNKPFIQFTLVDCPGHASFIKSVIAGASIIDLMILIVDSKKGIQVQTAECLALGEIMRLPITIVMNKVDMYSVNEMEDKNGVFQKLQKTLISLISKTSFPNRDNVKVISHSVNMNEEDKWIN